MNTKALTRNSEELILALGDMDAQSEWYRPTAFWREASVRIAEEIIANGIENFRASPLALNFFVPTYGTPGSGFSEAQTRALLDYLRTAYPTATKPQLSLEHYLSGRMSALADYRVLLAADDPARLPYLHTFSESRVGGPIEHFEIDSRRMSRSSLNYLLGLCLIKKHLGKDIPRTVLEIGGGYGTLGEVLSSGGIDGLRYIDIDIPPIHFVAQSYLCDVLGANNVATYAQTRHKSIIDIRSLPKFSVLCSWQIEKLRGEIDLFVNFMSFQEMEPHIVKNYLSHVVRLNARWILLRNIREGKQTRQPNSSVGVDTPTMSDDYLAFLPDYDLVERNVLPFGFCTVDGYHSEVFLLKRRW